MNTEFWQLLTVVFGGALGIWNFYLTSITRGLDKTKTELTDLKIQIAREYVTFTSLKELKDEFNKRFDRLESMIRHNGGNPE